MKKRRLTALLSLILITSLSMNVYAVPGRPSGSKPGSGGSSGSQVGGGSSGGTSVPGYDPGSGNGSSSGGGSSGGSSVPGYDPGSGNDTSSGGNSSGSSPGNGDSSGTQSGGQTQGPNTGSGGGEGDSSTSPGGSTGGEGGNTGGEGNTGSEGGDNTGGEGEGEGGGGGGGAGGSEGDGEGIFITVDGVEIKLGDIIVNVKCDCPKLKPYETYVPKVGYLKSVNAALVDYYNESVYFVPKLEDFPVDLTTTVTHMVDGYGENHDYALVYNGYFDNDVEYVLASPLIVDEEGNTLPEVDEEAEQQASIPKVTTSKKVYSAEDNSRLLNMVGYDLLLSKEDIPLWMEESSDASDSEEGDSGGELMMDYIITKVGKSEMKVETLVMDLYKVMGVYEWQINVGYSGNDDFNINQSPLLEKISFMTSADVITGVDSSECEIWVAATRTNPDLYWKRAIRDAIFDGGLHNATSEAGTFVGSETSVSAMYNRNDTMTLGEFCALARAIMTLYGEPVLTIDEQEACMLAYGVVLPKNSYSQEIYDSIVYLAAKGIVDPSQKNFGKNVTFRDIEDILLRIADKDARIQVKPSVASVFASKGFSKIEELTIPANDTYVCVTNVDDLQYVDYLVEHTFNTTFWITRRISGYDESYTSDDATTGTRASTGKPSQEEIYSRDRMVQSVENMGLVVDGVFIPPEDGVWKFEGIENYLGRSFYHIKINPNAKDDNGSIFTGKRISLSYDEQENEKLIRGHSTDIVRPGGDDPGFAKDQYHVSVPQSLEGGVLFYTEKRGEENYDEPMTYMYPEKVMSFDEAGFDMSFRDTSRYTAFHDAFNVMTSKFDMLKEDGQDSEDVEYVEGVRESIGMSVDTSDNKWATPAPPGFQLDSHYIVSYDVDISDVSTVQWLNNVALSDTEWDFKALFKSANELRYNERISVTQDVTAYLMEYKEDPDDPDSKRCRFEFYCNDTNALFSKGFIQELLIDDPNVQSPVYRAGYVSAIGYYRATDGTILVSVNSLIEKGAVIEAEAINADTLIVKTAVTNTNVTLHKGDQQYIMVGDTLFVRDSEDVIFEHSDDDYYIDYRACIGWGQEFILVPTGDASSAILMSADTYNNPNIFKGKSRAQGIKATFTSSIKQAAITTIPLSSGVLNVPVMVTNNYGLSGNKGILLTGSYALAPYIIVDAGDTNGIDYLFVYHLSGYGATEDFEDDSDARNLFSELTGVTLDASDDYFLAYYALDKEALRNNIGNRNGYIQSGGDASLSYMSQKISGRNLGTVDVIYGWRYTPKSYTDISAALKDYANLTGIDKDDHSVIPTLPISIFYYENDETKGYYDANVNACRIGIGEPLCDIGVLPSAFWGKTDNLFGIITESLEYTSYGEETSSNAQIVPAPAGAFAQFKGGKDSTLQELKGESTVFWGTSRLVYRSGNYVLPSGYSFNIRLKDTATCAYKGATTSTDVYIVNTGVSGLTLDINNVRDKLMVAFHDAEESIDWDEFSFSQLVTKLDSGMSVVLVFVLNVVPRVCILLFFLLMLLSLIKDFTLWRRFCETKFDVYKALTFGHVSVLTIDLRRLVISSMLSISVFMLIMDGTVIKVVTFIARFLLTLAQL